jgi:8-oxo-dGTP pyrophosphatase MutT (NUDIX family)
MRPIALRADGRVQRTYDFEFFKVRWLPRYGWIMDRPPAVVIVPIASDGRLWLAQLDRVPTKTRSWELPGGGIDRGEDVVAAGLRELEEECGLVARGGGRALRAVIELAPGMGRFPHRVVVARDVAPRGRRAEPQREEGIVAVRRFDRASVKRMIRSGRISVGATLAALVASGWWD